MIDILGKEKDHGRGGARAIYFRTISQEDGGEEREEGRGVVGKERERAGRAPAREQLTVYW